MSKRIIALVVILSVLAAGICVNAEVGINCTINGREFSPENRIYIEDGEYYFPFSELMKSMGFEIAFNSEKSRYEGVVNQRFAAIVPDSYTAEYDSVSIELSRQSKSVTNDVMVPLEFIERLYGITPTVSDNTVEITVTYICKPIGIDVEKIVTEKGVVKSELVELTNFNHVPYGINRGWPKIPGRTISFEISPKNYTPDSNSYDASLGFTNNNPIEKNDVIIARFYARMVKTDDESGMGKMRVDFEQRIIGTKQYKGGVYYDDLTTEWKKYCIPFKVTDNLDVKQSALRFKIGYCEQTLQISDVTVTNYGTSLDFIELTEGSKAEISCTVNNTELDLENRIYIEDGEYFFPFSELMESMGFEITFNSEKNRYEGIVNQSFAAVVPDSYTAEYDLVPIELSRQSKSVTNDVMVPLEFIEMLYGITPTVSENAATITVTYMREPIVLDVEKIVTEKGVVKSELVELTNYNHIPLGINRVWRTITGRTVTFEISPESDVSDSPAYDAQLGFTNNNPIEKNDVIVARFYARLIETDDESGMGKMKVDYEERFGDTSHYEGGGYYNDLTTEWKKYCIPFKVTDNLAEKGGSLRFKIGYGAQTLQISDVTVTNYGTSLDFNELTDNNEVVTSYYGQEDDALWRQEALKRIEKYRTKKVSVTARTSDGAPIEGVEVTANMTRSEFMWGTMVNEDILRGAYYDKYRDIIKSTFNAVVPENAMKNTGFNPIKASEIANFAAENNMYLRAHNLFWDAPSHMKIGTEINNMTEEEALEYLKAHASKVMSFYGSGAKQVDVFNEMVSNRTLRSKFGYEFIGKYFETVKKIKGSSKLYLNEHGVTGDIICDETAKKIDNVVKKLNAVGVDLDGVGIQNHVSGFVHPQRFYNQLSTVGQHVDEICVTEYSWVSGIADTDTRLQTEADFLRDNFIIAYSHPKTTGFLMWGFSDLRHWRDNGPLYDKSLNPKEKAVEYWNKYVNGEWKTNETVTTAADGSAEFVGHRGEYSVTVSYGGETANSTLRLKKDADNSINIVIDNSGKIAIDCSETVTNEQKGYFDSNILKRYEAELENAHKTEFEPNKKIFCRDAAAYDGSGNRISTTGKIKTAENPYVQVSISALEDMNNAAIIVATYNEKNELIGYSCKDNVLIEKSKQNLVRIPMNFEDDVYTSCSYMKLFVLENMETLTPVEYSRGEKIVFENDKFFRASDSFTNSNPSGVWIWAGFDNCADTSFASISSSYSPLKKYVSNNTELFGGGASFTKGGATTNSIGAYEMKTASTWVKNSGVARVFVAPQSGKIKISAEDKSGNARISGYVANGNVGLYLRITKVNRNGSADPSKHTVKQLWPLEGSEYRLDIGNSDCAVLDFEDIFTMVNKNDMIYFEAYTKNVINNGLYNKVYWNPTIAYE